MIACSDTVARFASVSNRLAQLAYPEHDLESVRMNPALAEYYAQIIVAFRATPAYVILLGEGVVSTVLADPPEGIEMHLRNRAAPRPHERAHGAVDRARRLPRFDLRKDS